MKTFFRRLGNILTYRFLRIVEYFEARRGDYSSLFYNSVLVFLAAMVLSDEWETGIGFIFMGIGLLLGTIFSKGDK
jgi:uncharacterized membrane protein YqgA involved in biofilm formation